MINYFDEAEKMLQSRGSLEQALANLERRRERIIKQSAPAGYPATDYTQPYTSTKNVNDAFTDVLELAEVMREIQVTRDTIREIDLVLDQLGEEDKTILRLWYIERKAKEEILDATNYSSSSTIYDLRNKAVSRFALLYFGAGALASV